MTPPVLAEVVRNGFVESRHRGSVVAVGPDGARLLVVGDVQAAVFPRSSLKPLQALGMLRSGWQPDDDEQVALAAASHGGEAMHIDVVRRILSAAGLDASSLDNTPGRPLDPGAADELIRSGGHADRLHQNCSGKHAAMLATCVAAGWPTEGYRAPDHPVQVAIRQTIEDLTGETVASVAVDGCGAPLFALSLQGLARGFSRLVTAPEGEPARRIADAMRAHPQLVGGSVSDVTALMRGVPGLLVKDGAEGVFVAALPDGTAVAIKVEDGNGRARSPIMVAVLRRLGVQMSEVESLAAPPVLGHGEPVGTIRPTLPG